MNAMFGDHVDWDKVRVLVGKNRPMGEDFFFFGTLKNTYLGC